MGRAVKRISLGPRRPHDLDQLLAQRERHDETDPGQRHRKSDDVGGDAEITVERQLAPTGERIAVDQRDRRMAGALDALEHGRHPRLGIRRLALLAAHLVQVHPGAERLARSADDDHADVTVLLELVEVAAQTVEHRGVHGIALLRPVQGERRDAVGDGAQDLVSHGLLSSGPPSRAGPSYDVEDPRGRLARLARAHDNRWRVVRHSQEATMGRRGLMMAVIGMALIAIGAGRSSAQRDLAKELVGTWEGSQQQLGATRGGETTNRERTLIIRSVRRSGDGWTVDSSFGVTGEKLTRFRTPAARLEETAEGVVLTLTYPSGTHVKLTLAEGDWLRGQHKGTGATRDRALSLKRVSTVPKKD